MNIYIYIYIYVCVCVCVRRWNKIVTDVCVCVCACAWQFFVRCKGQRIAGSFENMPHNVTGYQRHPMTNMSLTNEFAGWPTLHSTTHTATHFAVLLILVASKIFQFWKWADLQILLGEFAKLRKAIISFATSLRLPAWNNTAPTRRISIKFGIWVFFSKICPKIQHSLKSDKNNGYFTWSQYIFLSHLVQFSSQWEIFQTKVVEKTEAHVPP